MTSAPGRPPERDAIRWSLVRSARARVTAGFYDRPRIRGRVADAVLWELQD